MADIWSRLIIFLDRRLCGTMSCALRRTIMDVTTGLYRTAIRRLLTAKQSAAKARAAVVGSGTVAGVAESGAP